MSSNYDKVIFYEKPIAFVSNKIIPVFIFEDDVVSFHPIAIGSIASDPITIGFI